MKSILVVDASTSHAQHIAETLGEVGYRVLVSHDTRGLMTLVKRHLPDAILLDEFMPALHGLKALRTLSRDPMTTHIPVVMLASRTQPAEKVRALWQGARDYLIKPVDSDRLVRLIDALMIDGVEEPRIDAVRLG